MFLEGLKNVSHTKFVEHAAEFNKTIVKLHLLNLATALVMLVNTVVNIRLGIRAVKDLDLPVCFIHFTKNMYPLAKSTTLYFNKNMFCV